MDRYFFEISFDGTAYAGWQRQKTAPSVQKSIEDILSILLQKEIRIHGCGRTDAGVHASQYFFHLDLESDPVSIAFKLNKMLAKDIAVLGFTKVHSNANAQKDARSRQYTYRIKTSKDPFSHRFAMEEFNDLDIGLMQEALGNLIGSVDFRNFCKRPEQYPSTICNIKNAEMHYEEQSDLIAIHITGNRFLHHMIRLLMGNIIKIGKGRLAIADFKAYLELEKKPAFFELAPAQGLSLSGVAYPEDLLLRKATPNAI